MSKSPFAHDFRRASVVQLPAVGAQQTEGLKRGPLGRLENGTQHPAEVKMECCLGEAFFGAPLHPPYLKGEAERVVFMLIPFFRLP